MHVTALDESHGSAYRDLMLLAYEESADAFNTTAAERRVEPEAWWLQRIGSASGSATTFGAWDGADLVGAVSIEYASKPKTRHTALILGMYVRPSHRTQGVARALMATVIAAARSRPHIWMLSLTLTEGNEEALRVYGSIGFSAWGTQPRAILTRSGLKGRIHMSMAVREPTLGA